MIEGDDGKVGYCTRSLNLLQEDETHRY